MNRLSREKSPYLLQHAANPVDWYPWGDEAFQKARNEDKPVFLSIGYSTCHWCHVMEEESFENKELAETFNRDFVCIKVDREERPDIDSAFMNAVQLMTGAGGWPLNVFITPDKQPFYGGTYFSPAQLKGVLRTAAEMWKNKRGEVALSAAQITAALNVGPGAATAGGPVSEDIFGRAFRELSAGYDPAYGGLGAAPKFPSGHSLSFLLLHYHRTGDKTALAMAENTLEHIAGGGIFDHLGGGFHRYSTDREWFLPHFEKMLYDQALLANAYLEAYQLTKKESYATVARQVFDYVLRDMTHPEGPFYSAEDADSAPDAALPGKKAEGAYYVWTRDEILAALGSVHGEIFSFSYGIKAGGNVAADPRREFSGKNVLSEAATVNETAAHFKKREFEIENILFLAKQKLFKARSRRPRPQLDDKVLTDWNGLMISSLARGAGILGQPRYGDAAKQAADFILARLITKEGTLLHRFRDDAAGIPGFLDDYAFFINGLLDLYGAVFDAQYLRQAAELGVKMLELFADKANGGFFLTAADFETIITGRAKEPYDGALPSGSSVAALCLVRLYSLTRKEEFNAALNTFLNSISGSLKVSPAAFTQLLIAADAALRPGKQIVIAAGKPEEPFITKAATLVRGRFLPGALLLLRPPLNNTDITAIAPWIKAFTPARGKTTVYVCADRVCLPPVTDLAGLKKLL